MIKFSKVHKDYLRDTFYHSYNIAEGAIRSGKTVDNVYAFCEHLEYAPERYHLASGVSVGSAKLILGDCNGLGIAHYFQGRCKWAKYLDNEALIVQTFENGEKVILFTGGGKAKSEATLTGKTIGMWIATEINLHHLDFIKEARRRTASSKYRKFFWDLNPSTNSDIFYTDVLEPLRQKGRVNHKLFRLFDNASLSTEVIENIVADYKSASDPWYRRDILGERLKLEGAIYKNFDRVRHSSSNIPFTPSIYYLGIDWGYSGSNTSFVLVATDYIDVCVVAAEKHSYERGSMDNIHLALRFTDKVKKKVGYFEVFPDYADAGLTRDYVRELRGTVKVNKTFKKYPILERISFLDRLHHSGRFSYIPKNCPSVPDAIEGAEWSKTSQRPERLDNGTSDIDTLDALEYALTRIYEYDKKVVY